MKPNVQNMTEQPIQVFDELSNCNWIKEEASVDSGAVECVTGQKRMLHLKLEETSVVAKIFPLFFFSSQFHTLSVECSAQALSLHCGSVTR